MSENPVPKEIGRSGQRDIRIEWKDGHQTVLEARRLRLLCPCAMCVDELTGVRRLSPGSVPQEVAPTSIELVGRYALRVYWSDGHSSGIYTFRLLRELCNCTECRSASGNSALDREDPDRSRR